MGSDGMILVTFQNLALGKDDEEKFLSALSPMQAVANHRVLEALRFDVIVISIGFIVSTVAKGFLEEAGKDLWRKWKPILDRRVKSRGGLTIHVDMQSIDAVIEIHRDASEVEGSLESLKDFVESLKQISERTTVEFNPKTKKWETKSK